MQHAAKFSVVFSWSSHIAITSPTTALYISRFRPALTVTRRYCHMSVPDRPRWFHDVIGVSFVVHEAGSNPEEAFRYPWCRLSGGWAILKVNYSRSWIRSLEGSDFTYIRCSICQVWHVQPLLPTIIKNQNKNETKNEISWKILEMCQMKWGRCEEKLSTFDLSFA